MKFSRNWAQPCNNKSGGDGETRLIKEIFGLLKIQRGRKFQIYAQPALQLLSTISMQLHNKGAGIKDELMRLQELTSIIDEISISSKILSQVESLCRNIRNKEFIFGKLQVILVGDFFSASTHCQ